MVSAVKSNKTPNGSAQKSSPAFSTARFQRKKHAERILKILHEEQKSNDPNCNFILTAVNDSTK